MKVHAAALTHGLDTRRRLLETDVLLFDSGNELVIHAMKPGLKYLDLLG